MKNTDQPGFLDPQLGDQTVDLPDHLSWDALGQGIIPPPPKRKRPVGWWLFFVAGAILLGAWQLNGPWSAASQAPAPSNPPATLSVQNELQNELSTAPASVKEQLVSAAQTFVEDEQKAAQSVQQLDLGLQSSTTVSLNSQGGSAATDPVQNTQPNPQTPARHPAQVVVADEQPALVIVALLPGIDFQLPALELLPNPEPVTVTQTTNKEELNRGNIQRLALAMGAGQFANAPGQFDPLPGLHALFQYEITTRKNWTFQVGGRLNRHVWRSELNRSEEIRLFRPGTIDSIYVNTTTGEERLVTTDTVSALAITRYRGYGKVTTLGLPMMAGKNWPFLGGHFRLSIGLEPSWVINRSGSSLNADSAISKPTFSDNFYLLFSGALAYHLPLSSRLDAFGVVSSSWSTQNQFIDFNTAGNWQQQQFAVGLSLRIGR